LPDGSSSGIDGGRRREAQRGVEVPAPRVAEDWLHGPGKEKALSVLDELVFEASGESPLNPD
jgi:hypothetical protein